MRRATFSVVASLVLLGCGQKGPLIKPPPPAAASAPAAASKPDFSASAPLEDPKPTPTVPPTRRTP